MKWSASPPSREVKLQGKMPEVILGTGILDSDVPYMTMEEHEYEKYLKRLVDTCMIQYISVKGYYPGDRALEDVDPGIQKFGLSRMECVWVNPRNLDITLTPAKIKKCIPHADHVLTRAFLTARRSAAGVGTAMTVVFAAEKLKVSKAVSATSCVGTTQTTRRNASATKRSLMPRRRSRA
jgi:hypothetical protein